MKESETSVRATDRKLIYICSPYSGDVASNTEKAKRYSRFAVDAGAIPIAPHLLLPLYMKEESERDLALQMDLVIMARCDEVWVFGSEITSGMRKEIEVALLLHIKTRRFIEDLKEVKSYE